jgi:hypothetical protein
MKHIIDDRGTRDASKPILGDGHPAQLVVVHRRKDDQTGKCKKAYHAPLPVKKLRHFHAFLQRSGPNVFRVLDQISPHFGRLTLPIRVVAEAINKVVNGVVDTR